MPTLVSKSGDASCLISGNTLIMTCGNVQIEMCTDAISDTPRNQIAYAEELEIWEAAVNRLNLRDARVVMHWHPSSGPEIRALLSLTKYLDKSTADRSNWADTLTMVIEQSKRFPTVITHARRELVIHPEHDRDVSLRGYLHGYTFAGKLGLFLDWLVPDEDGRLGIR